MFSNRWIKFFIFIFCFALIIWVNPASYVLLGSLVFLLRLMGLRIPIIGHFVFSLICGLFIVDSFFAPMDVFQDFPSLVFTNGLHIDGWLDRLLALAMFFIVFMTLKFFWRKFSLKPYSTYLIYLFFFSAVAIEYYGFPYLKSWPPFLFNALVYFYKNIWILLLLLSPFVSLSSAFLSCLAPFFALFADKWPQVLLSKSLISASTEENCYTEIYDFTLFYAKICVVFVAMKSLTLLLAFQSLTLDVFTDHKLYRDIFYTVTQQLKQGHWKWLPAYIFGNLTFYVHLFFFQGEAAIWSARLAGYQLPSNTDSPWQARSFKDFFFKSAYYYSQIVINYFYTPFRHLFYTKLKHRKALLDQLSLIYSIFIGGLIIHYFRTVPIAFSGIKTSPLLWGRSFFYFLGFSIACAYFSGAKIKNHWLRFSLFLVVYILMRLLYDLSDPLWRFFFNLLRF